MQAAAPLSPEFAAALTGLGAAAAGDTISQAAVCSAHRAERRVASTFHPVLAVAADTGESDAPSVAGSAGGQGALTHQLDVVARCVTAGVPTSVYSVSLGGFDTHADEAAVWC